MTEPLRVEVDSDRDLVVDVAPGDQVELVLRRGATGHVWLVEPGPDCRLVARTSDDSNPASFGGDVIERVVVEPQASTEVTLKLKRPWEEEATRTARVAFQLAGE